MGNRSSTQELWTPEELTEYTELTYLGKKDIIHAFKTFQQLAPHLVEDRQSKLPHRIIKGSSTTLHFRCNRI